METKKVGWYILLAVIIFGVIEYFDVINYLTGKQAEKLTFTQWMLTPVAWSIVALILIGIIMIKLGRRRYPMQMPAYR